MGEISSGVGTALPVKRPRRRRLLIGLGVVAGLVVAAEVLLRLVFGFGSPVLYQVDAAAGYVPQPNQHVYRFFCHNDINHASMRSDEFAMPKPAGVYRVLFIGDSVTYGTTHVDQPLIFTSLLGKSLHAPAGGGEGRRVEVLNMSAGGWGPQNEVGYLMSRGTFDADVVALVLNTGDPGEEFAPLHHADVNYPLASPMTAIGEVWSRYVLPRLFHETIAGDAGTTLPSPEVTDQRAVANFLMVEKGRDFAEKAGAVFGIVHVPFAGWKREVIEHSEKLIADFAVAHHVPLIDVAGALEAEDAGKMTMDGMHLKPEGDAVVAREIERQWGVMEGARVASGPATQK